MAQYKKELRYLDFYMGIVPANKDGAIDSDEELLSKYVSQASELNCRFDEPCGWTNTPSDGLLDSSDFYLFKKNDSKSFPIQIRPGNPEPDVDAHFVLAGNTTSQQQSAILISAPVACQKSKGTLKFQYWLHNSAKIEIVLLKVNPSNGHLHVLNRPRVDCHYLKAPKDECRIDLDPVAEPFKFGIRVFGLDDPSIGSFAMITDIRYAANICGTNDVPSLFGGIPLPKSSNNWTPLEKTSDLNCAENIQGCRWFPIEKSMAKWRIGKHKHDWSNIMRSKSYPDGDFIFQYIDPMAELPLGHLQSELVQCTQAPSSLSFRYWMSPGIQAQLCTVSAENVSLSCIYLNENDSPGPITIDIDTADRHAFRFTIEVIKFESAHSGVFVVDDISYTGLLCTERAPLPEGSPLNLEMVFDLQPVPRVGINYLETLDCDFEVDYCSHWENPDDLFQQGFVPAVAPFEIPKPIRGNAAIALFEDFNQQAIFISQQISCAENGRLTVTYYSSEGSQISVCADNRCVKQRRPSGQLSVNVTSDQPFRLKIVAESIYAQESFVIVKRIETTGQFCRIQMPTEVSCLALECNFKEQGLCNYRSDVVGEESVPFVQIPNQGIGAKLVSEKSKRAILRSPEFRLSSLAELRFRTSISTFGARLFICPDENVQNVVENCELLLGPKIDQKKLEIIQIQLDPEIQHFALVAYHDKYLQFGDASFLIEHIELVDKDGNLLC
uniref:MAM domain-containing protein n=1 Tax=Acrobeloides nanus TaxID=290746 RepID=A0A914BV11_9BILA